jgi:hypothetical protein
VCIFTETIDVFSLQQGSSTKDSAASAKSLCMLLKENIYPFNHLVDWFSQMVQNKEMPTGQGHTRLSLGT